MGLSAFHDGGIAQLFFDISAYVPFFGYVSGERVGGKHHHADFVCGYDDDVEPDDGHCLRNSDT